MKRDPDLLRAILLWCEDNLPGPYQDGELTVDDFSSEQVTYHLMLLVQDGLIDGTDVSTISSFCTEYFPRWLTPAGCDYLDQIRDPKIWKQTKSAAKEAGGFSLDLLKELAKGFIVTQIKTKTGIDLR